MKYELNANLKYVLTSDDSISFGECTMKREKCHLAVFFNKIGQFTC